MNLTLGDSEITLLPGRALFLPRSATLVVADIHLGKSATFRTRGLPVPEGSTAADLARLTDLVQKSGAESIVIAGDLVHAADGLREAVREEFDTWLRETGIKVTLTEGNHDSRAHMERCKFALEVVPECERDGLIITHDPADLPADAPGIAGHLHPGIKIKETGRSSIRMGGYFLNQSRHLVLPAFSEFTGLQILKMTETDRFFAEVGGRVREIPAAMF